MEKFKKTIWRETDLILRHKTQAVNQDLRSLGVNRTIPSTKLLHYIVKQPIELGTEDLIRLSNYKPKRIMLK